MVFSFFVQMDECSATGVSWKASVESALDMAEAAGIMRAAAEAPCTVIEAFTMSDGSLPEKLTEGPGRGWARCL
jgi:hypothetical protein